VSRYVEAHRGRFGVEPICRALDVSASAYYQRKTGARSSRAIEDERLLGVIRQVHESNYFAYGYRRMWKALKSTRRLTPTPRGASTKRSQSLSTKSMLTGPSGTSRRDGLSSSLRAALRLRVSSDSSPSASAWAAARCAVATPAAHAKDLGPALHVLVGEAANLRQPETQS